MLVYTAYFCCTSQVLHVNGQRFLFKSTYYTITTTCTTGHQRFEILIWSSQTFFKHPPKKHDFCQQNKGGSFRILSCLFFPLFFFTWKHCQFGRILAPKVLHWPPKTPTMRQPPQWQQRRRRFLPWILEHVRWRCFFVGLKTRGRGFCESVLVSWSTDKGFGRKSFVLMVCMIWWQYMQSYILCMTILSST